jgi:hypothetical protein
MTGADEEKCVQPGARQLAAANAAPRCTGRRKHGAGPCKAAAVNGYAVCRMHGARGGAPKGNTNRLVHGRRTKEVDADRHASRATLRAIQAMIAAINEGET